MPPTKAIAPATGAIGMVLCSVAVALIPPTSRIVV